MRTRIDQFGVAQPNINPDRERGIITVELQGIQDQERVRKYLQSSVLSWRGKDSAFFIASKVRNLLWEKSSTP